jgi:hypothetical protein
MYQRSKIMKHYFPTIAALAVTFMGSVFVPALKADEWDKRTIIKIDKSIDVQGTMLPPGSYVIKLLGGSSDRRTVQIFSTDENRLIATVFAVPAWRLAPTDNSEFRFYEVAEGRPPALHTWFYPGDNSGFGFIRSGRREMATQTPQRHANTATSNAGGE